MGDPVLLFNNHNFFCIYCCVCIHTSCTLECIQAMYDASTCGRHLRKYVGVSLAWWHNYKWATARIFTVFAPDFIAPFYHSLFPDRSCDVNKMSHPAITTILSYMRIAYPSFRDALINAIESDDHMPPRSLDLLHNMYTMLEYFIPVVCIDLFACAFVFLCWQFEWLLHKSSVMLLVLYMAVVTIVVLCKT